MSKALRLSEKWFRFGLWVVAFVFASFLIGLGGTIVQNLPRVEHHYTQEDFIDKPQAEQARNVIKQSQKTRTAAQESLEQARLRHNVARANSATARGRKTAWPAATDGRQGRRKRRDWQANASPSRLDFA